MKTLKIFLASSNELEHEREMMASLANSLNTVLEKQGVNVIVVQWENLDASMGVNHKQEDYNEKLRECDMCMVLYWTKFGMYTKIELETAFNELKAGHNPKKVYVYFKEDESTVAEELKEFRDSFPTRYGHFYTPFSNFDTLKAHFLLQFMEYQSQVLPEGRGVEVRNGKVTIDGTDYVDLKNVPFAGNNEEYQLLQKNIKKTQKLLAITETDDPDYSEYAKDLNEMKEKLAKMESSLWDTALMITRLSTTKCSERLERAMQLFNKGDNKGALAVLNEEEIEKDAQHNINLIKLGETGREGLQTNIKEYEMRVSSLMASRYDGWLGEYIRLREKIAEWNEFLYGHNSKECSKAITNLGYAYRANTNYRKALQFYLQAKDINETVLGENHIDTAWSYSDLAMVYSSLQEHSAALEWSQKALRLMEIILGDKHPTTAKMYHNIATIYSSSHDTNNAFEYYFKALSSLEKKRDIAIVYGGIGKCYVGQENYGKAMEYYLTSLHTLESAEDVELHQGLLAESLFHIGWVYEKMNDSNNALEYYFKALAILERKYGIELPFTANLYIRIGRIFYKNDNLDRSELYFEKIAQHINIENHIRAKSVVRLFYLYVKKGQQDKALEAIDSAIALDPLKPHYIHIKGKYLFSIGRYDEAKALWMEVIKLDPGLDKNSSQLFTGLKRKGLI